MSWSQVRGFKAIPARISETPHVKGGDVRCFLNDSCNYLCWLMSYMRLRSIIAKQRHMPRKEAGKIKGVKILR